MSKFSPFQQALLVIILAGLFALLTVTAYRPLWESWLKAMGFALLVLAGTAKLVRLY